jgi:hypothetical protein
MVFITHIFKIIRSCIFLAMGGDETESGKGAEFEELYPEMRL